MRLLRQKQEAAGRIKIALLDSGGGGRPTLMEGIGGGRAKPKALAYDRGGRLSGQELPLQLGEGGFFATFFFPVLRML